MTHKTKEINVQNYICNYNMLRGSFYSLFDQETVFYV